MKHSQFAIFSLALAYLTIQSCNFSHNLQWSFFGKNHTSMIFDDDNGKRIKIKYHGDFVINDEETGFESMSPSALLSFSKDNIHFSASSDETGNITYKINDVVTTGTNNEKAIIAEVISELINAGFASEIMAQKWMDKGGLSLLISKVKGMKSDYIKAYYTTFILKQDLNSNEEWHQVFVLIDKIHSDYEKSNILQKIPVHNFNQFNIAESYIQIVAQIQSDYEKANAIKYILNNSKAAISSPSLTNAIGSIHSEYEKSMVLQSLLENNENSKEIAIVATLAKDVHSDYEKSQVLQKYFALNNTDSTFINNGLAAAATIDSDFEASNIIESLSSKKMPQSSAIHQGVLNVINTIESSFEKSRAMHHWMPNVKGENQWVSMLNEIEKLDSDYEKEQLLDQCKDQLPSNLKVTEAFKKAVRTLNNDMALGKLLRSVQ